MPGLGVLSSAGVALGATLLSKLLETKTWTIVNEETREVIKGQFPDEGNNFEFGSEWGEMRSLNRRSPLLQYLHGQTDRFDVSSQFFRRDVTDDSPTKKLDRLLEFTRRDQRLGRPPICRFAIGDGSVINLPVILHRVNGIKYSQPDFFGGIRQVSFSLQFSRHTRFSLAEEAVTDTRYHRTARGQYYELIAGLEYGDPLLGDFIRKQPEQIGKPLLVPGNVVKLPALEGVKDKIVSQTSVILKTAFGRAETVQKQRFTQMLEILASPSVGTPVETLGIDFGPSPIPVQIVEGDGFGSGNFGSTPFGAG